MPKSKSPPTASFEKTMELAPLLMEIFDFQGSSNDLGDTDVLSMLILSAITVSDADDHPMAADEVAFSLDLPVRNGEKQA